MTNPFKDDKEFKKRVLISNNFIEHHLISTLCFIVILFAYINTTTNKTLSLFLISAVSITGILTTIRFLYYKLQLKKLYEEQ